MAIGKWIQQALLQLHKMPTINRTATPLRSQSSSYLITKVATYMVIIIVENTGRLLENNRSQLMMCTVSSTFITTQTRTHPTFITIVMFAHAGPTHVLLPFFYIVTSVLFNSFHPFKFKCLLLFLIFLVHQFVFIFPQDSICHYLLPPWLSSLLGIPLSFIIISLIEVIPIHKSHLVNDPSKKIIFWDF